jgi:hypothetical protein
MLTGVINLRRLAGSKVRLNAALRRQCSLVRDDALGDDFRLADQQGLGHGEKTELHSV